MSLKDILVCVDRTVVSAHRLRLALDLASRHGSRLTALFVHEWTETQRRARSAAEVGLVSGAALGVMDRRVEASINDGAQELRTLVEMLGRERGVVTDWRVIDGPASVTVPQHARYADLCILGHDRTMDADSNTYSFSEKLLFTSGRPALFVPASATETTLGRHVVIAWNSSRASARSVNDALSIIERSEKTTVITINPDDFIIKNGGLPANNLVEHLTQHGASVELVELNNISTNAIGDIVQATTREVGGDLLITGAFGHPRMWERLLGGTTRDLLDRMNVPTLMSN